MLKLMAKKGKENKGFTLIELIVVIAIIAILALLLVPRFTGFTNNARISNDRSACVTLEKAFLTLLSNKSIETSAGGTVTITGSTWAISGTYTGPTALAGADGTYDATEMQNVIEELTGTVEVQATGHTRFTVTIGTDGRSVSAVVS